MSQPAGHIEQADAHAIMIAEPWLYLLWPASWLFLFVACGFLCYSSQLAGEITTATAKFDHKNVPRYFKENNHLTLQCNTTWRFIQFLFQHGMHLLWVFGMFNFCGWHWVSGHCKKNEQRCTLELWQGNMFLRNLQGNMFLRNLKAFSLKASQE